MRANIDWKSAF